MLFITVLFLQLLMIPVLCLAAAKAIEYLSQTEIFFLSNGILKFFVLHRCICLYGILSFN